MSIRKFMHSLMHLQGTGKTACVSRRAQAEWLIFTFFLLCTNPMEIPSQLQAWAWTHTSRQKEETLEISANQQVSKQNWSATAQSQRCGPAADLCPALPWLWREHRALHRLLSAFLPFCLLSEPPVCPGLLLTILSSKSSC